MPDGKGTEVAMETLAPVEWEEGRRLMREEVAARKPIVARMTASFYSREISLCIASETSQRTPLERHWQKYRRRAAKRGGNGTAWSEDLDETLNSGVRTESREHETAESVDDQEAVEVPVLLETTDPALHAGVVADCSASGRIEAFAGEGGVELASVSEIEPGREGVCVVQYSERRDYATDADQVRHGRGDDEGDSPVDRSKNVPHEATPLRGDLWELESLLENLNVDSLHADVEIQQAGNPTGDETEDVAGGLQTSGIDG
ncbi:hypothetical protein MRB53_041853 [Persea americana]|nr:hypothetical protein MRB53_041853 [Persea americana]